MEFDNSATALLILSTGSRAFTVEYMELLGLAAEKLRVEGSPHNTVSTIKPSAFNQYTLFSSLEHLQDWSVTTSSSAVKRCCKQ